MRREGEGGKEWSGMELNRRHVCMCLLQPVD